MRQQPPARVVNQLLGRQPAHALDEAALDLAEIDRRIERAADIVEDIDRQHLVLAGQRVDRHLGQRRAISEIEEGPAADAWRGHNRSSASHRSRSRSQRDPPDMRHAAESGERNALAARHHAVAREAHRLVARSRTCSPRNRPAARGSWSRR
jgi:hypothetical protein